MASTQYATGVAEQQLTIRGIDMELWKEVRKEAIDQRVSAGELLNGILRNWLEQKDRRPSPPPENTAR